MPSIEPSLLLLPNLLGPSKSHGLFLPVSIDDAMANIDGIIAESVQSGRSFLKRFKLKKAPHDIPLALFNKHTPDKDIDFLLEPMTTGETWGFVTDAGLPCIADPGAKLVTRARSLGIAVKTFPGPSSIMMSLMLSGLPGQRFAFHGYIAKNIKNREKEIVTWDRDSRKNRNTQIFIEAPFRNMHTLEALLQFLSEKTLLCVACDLTLESQEVMCMSIAQWKKKSLPNLHKRPAIFLFCSPSV